MQLGLLPPISDSSRPVFSAMSFQSPSIPAPGPDCMVLDQPINNNTWKNLKFRGLNEKFQKRKPSRRTNGGFINDVHSSWDEMKIDHIRNAIDAQRDVMLQIIKKKRGATNISHFKCSKLSLLIKQGE